MKRVVLDETTRRESKGTCCTEKEGRTRQEDAPGTDLEGILRRYAQGVLPVSRPGVFADISGIGDLRQSLEKVRAADEAFMSLPAEVRSAFENDPAQFVEAFQSEEGIAKLRELKVVPETEETLAERREAAYEARVEKRREAREVAKRIEAAKSPPVEK